MKTKEIHIHNVKIGDVIFHAGQPRTVGRDDIKLDPFMGRSVFGDSYCLGYRKVILVDPKSL